MSNSPQDKSGEPGMMTGPVFDGPDELLTALREIGVQDTTENYFCLIARDIPEFPIFVTDARGDGYAILDRETTLYLDMPVGEIELDVEKGKSGAGDKRTLENYPHGAWEHVQEAMQAYILTEEALWDFYLALPKVQPVDPAKRLVMRVPGGDEEHFLKTLVEEVWSLPMETFRYQLQWAKF